jgi:hypothetical protein
MKWMSIPNNTGDYNDDDKGLSIINIIWPWRETGEYYTVMMVQYC